MFPRIHPMVNLMITVRRLRFTLAPVCSFGVYSVHLAIRRMKSFFLFPYFAQRFFSTTTVQVSHHVCFALWGGCVRVGDLLKSWVPCARTHLVFCVFMFV